MTTLFDIGDEITLTITGVVKEFSCSKSGDCYVVEISDKRYDKILVYLDTMSLKASNAQLLSPSEYKRIERFQERTNDI